MRDEIERGTQRTREGLEACCRLLGKLGPDLGKLARHAEHHALDYQPAAELAPTVKQLEGLFLGLIQEIQQAGIDLASVAPAEVDLTGPAEPARRPAGRQTSSPHADGACTFRGSAPALPVATLLQFLSTQNKTGTLVVSARDETFTVELVSGGVVHAVSNGTPLDERLGSLLLKRGSLGAEQLTELLQRAKAEKVPLGELLEQEQLVAREDLQAALEEQVQLMFRRLFAQREAQFAFYEGSDHRPEIQIDMDMTRLLLESARSSDEDSAQPVAAWEDWLK